MFELLLALYLAFSCPAHTPHVTKSGSPVVTAQDDPGDDGGDSGDNGHTTSPPPPPPPTNN